MTGMAQALVFGLSQIASVTAFGLMLLGIAIGFLVGILPGLGGPTTLALMLPFVVKMNPVEAFCFLLGMTAVVNTTGDITSILIGVPGEPTAAATVVDGHPMAKKGEAGRALGAVLMSSLVGAIFGALALASAIPVVRPLVLTFGSPEFFMLAVLGITFVASLSGQDFMRGLISGGLGLLLATVGLDPMSGIQRYTFGQTFLWDGIGLVPITLGFFAIPEVVDLAVQRSTIAGGRVEKLGGVMDGVKDTFRHWWMVIRCSAIGAYAAVIPGIGGATTQWLAYAHAVQSSRDRERFGKGAVEGVLGPGAANNSTLGGSLITTIAFGIPASITMAILLGAFLIHGVVPGPDMLIPEPQGHLGLTFSFVWITVISNIITVGLCFLFLKQLIRVTQIRGSLLLPLIIMLIFLGAFAEKNTFEDLVLVLMFGGLGWILQRLNWPRPPLILGLVLGPLAESRLFLSTDNYGAAWLARPGVLAIGVLTLVGGFYPLLQRWQARRRQIGQPSVPNAASTNGAEPSQLNWGILFNLLILAGLVWALWESRRFNFRAGLFPWAIGFPVLGFVITQCLMELTGKVSNAGGDVAVEGSDLSRNVVNRRTAGIFAWIAGYFVAIWLFGFSTGVTLCTFAQLKIGAHEKWSLSLILTATTWAFTYGFFGRLLHIPFPDGHVSLWLNLPSFF